MPIPTARFRVSGTTSYGKDVDTIVTLELLKSSQFAYGNQTAVRLITPDGGDFYFDTRYDKTLRRDGSNFQSWAKSFAESYFDHGLTVQKIKK